MLQLLLEVYQPMDNSDSFDHHQNHLHGLWFQAWSYGAWLALLRHCSGDLPCTSLTSSSPADSSMSKIAGCAAAFQLDCRCPNGPGSLSPAPPALSPVWGSSCPSLLSYPNEFLSLVSEELGSAGTAHVSALTFKGDGGAPLLVSHALPACHPLKSGTYLVALLA